MSDFTKLSLLINQKITVESVGGVVYKKWDAQNNKMLTSPVFMSGYRKIYPTVTDKGQLDFGSGQIGALLEAVFTGGSANLIGRTFEIKSNGKTGVDIRYFFNALEPDASDSAEEPEYGKVPY